MAGARDARIELEKPFPDLRAARRGLLQARNHPADIPGMIDLFRRFRPFGFMADGARLWAQGDALFAQLDAAAQSIHGAIRSGRGNPADLQPMLVEMREQDRELTAIERTFSATFAEASRQIERVLTIATILIAVALVLAAILRTQRLIRNEDAFHSALRASQQRYDHAISGTNDGIWDWNLAQSRSSICRRASRSCSATRRARCARRAGSFLRRVHPADRRRVARARCSEHLRSGDPFDLEFRLRTRDGALSLVPRARPLGPRRARQAAARMAGSLADIPTASRPRRSCSRRRSARRSRWRRSPTPSSPSTRPARRIHEPGRRAADRLAHRRSARRRRCRRCSRCSRRGDRRAVADPVARALARRRDDRVGGQHRAAAPRTRVRSRSTTASAPIRDRARGIVGAVLVFHDMSRERQYAARLSHLASHDALTGLLNRREFEQPRHAGARRAASTTTSTTSGALPRPRPVQGRQRHLRPRRRRRAAAPGERAAAAAAARGRHARAPGRRRVRRAAGALPARRRRSRIAEALRKTIGDFRFDWNQRSFTIGVSIGLVNLAERPAHARGRAVRGRRRLLHGEGQGPQPRAGLPAPRATRWRCATARWNG